MECHRNAPYFFPTDSTESTIQDSPPFPNLDPGQVPPSQAVGSPWVDPQCDWNTGLSIYPPYNGSNAEPPFVGNPQTLQTVPQFLFSEAFSQPSWTHPVQQQSVRPSKFWP